MTKASKVPATDLARWRNLDAFAVLQAVASHMKRDVTYRPRSATGTTRWHVRLDDREFELLLTGPKFWDMQAKKGGGGALDLLMQLQGVSFQQATATLKSLGV